MTTTSPLRASSALSVRSLLRPHTKALAIGLLAVIGEAIAGLLGPWPLKIVFDHVGKGGASHGKLDRLLPPSMNPQTVLLVVALAVIAIALLDAVCTYAEKYTTTSVGQWVMHDLRRLLYAHIHRLSLSYHDAEADRRPDQPRHQRHRRHAELHRVRACSSLAIDTLTLIGMAA